MKNQGSVRYLLCAQYVSLRNMLHYELDRSPRGRLGMHFEIADISVTDTVFFKNS